MDVRAIILIGAPTEPYQASNGNGTSLAQLRNGRISAVPMALLPFFGRSLATRVAEQLVQAGIDHVAILSTSEAPFAEQRTSLGAQISWKKESPENIWRSAEDEFAELAQGGAELVLVL